MAAAWKHAKCADTDAYENILDGLIDDEAAIWYCPYSPENANLTLSGMLHLRGHTYSWGFNASNFGRWCGLTEGDVCVFWKNERALITRVSRISPAKFITTRAEEEQWKFRSPSGKPWKYGFAVDRPIPMSIDRGELADTQVKFVGPQSQYMLNPRQNSKMRALILSKIGDDELFDHSRPVT